MNWPIYQVKITLQDIEPPIWRRLLVSSNMTLAKFHKVIQAAMGWSDAHLHMFKVGVVRFMVPYDPTDLMELTAIDARRVKLIHLVPHHRPFKEDFHFAFEYEYDFGDSWQHEIVFEDVQMGESKQKVPICIEGARACPPESVGGARRYQEFLAAIQNPEHGAHQMYMGWSEGDFNAEAFDLDAVNKRLKVQV